MCQKKSKNPKKIRKVQETRKVEILSIRISFWASTSGSQRLLADLDLPNLISAEGLKAYAVVEKNLKTTTSLCIARHLCTVAAP